MEARRFVSAALLSANLLTPACGPEPQEKTVSRNAEVVCIDVDGFPKFNEGRCGEFADEVSTGLNYMSELTDGKVPSSHVTSRLLSETVDIEDALDIRCTDINHATSAERQRLKTFSTTVAGAALKEVAGLDFNEKLLVVAVNAPESICRPDSPPTSTGTEATPTSSQKCIDIADKPVSYRKASTLTAETGHSFVLAFKAVRPEIMKIIMAHERGHALSEQLGHELMICNKNGDTIPSVIGTEQTGLDLQLAESGSLMSYDMSEQAYLAPPHLAYLDIIKKEQIVTPEQAGTFTLSDNDQEGPKLLQMELSNPAVRGIVEESMQPYAEVDKSISIDNFSWFIGKLPGKQAIGVYVAPIPGKHKNDVPRDFSMPIFRLNMLQSPGETITVEGDMQLELLQSNNDTMVVHVRPR